MNGRLRGLTALGLAGGIALIPLSAQVVALDPTRPPIPLLVPPAGSVVILLLTLAALAAVVPAAVRAARRDALTAVFLVPGLGVILSGAVGFDPPTGIGLGVIVTGIGGSGLALAREADAATVRLVTRAFLWSALAASAFALVLVVTRHPAAVYAYDNGRAVGTFLNPNELAAYSLFGLGVALPLAVGSRGRDRLAVVCAALLLIALAATFSRWGAFSAVCGVAVYALFARRRRLLAVALAIALIGLGLNALAGGLHHNPRDTEARLAAWRAGLTTFERFPLLGVGPLAYGRTYAALRPPAAPGPQTPVAFDPHSMPLAFAADAGLVAVASLTAWYVIVLRRIIRAAGAAAGTPRLVGFGLAAALVALLVDGALNTVSLSFALVLQVAPLALAVLRTDAP